MILASARLLVVEDDPVMSRMLAATLTSVGGVVVGPATTLASALRAAEFETFDGALLDFNLGNERSLAVAEVLKRRGIPFLFVTGSEPALIEVACPNQQVMQKPVMLVDLIAAISAW